MRSGTIPQAALFPRPHDVAVFRVIASSSRKKSPVTVQPRGELHQTAISKRRSPPHPPPPFMGRSILG